MLLDVLAAGARGSFSEETKLFERSVTSTNTILDLWWLWLLLIAIVAIGLWLSSVSKGIGALDARCKSAFADIDAILSERHALIPNLVEVTRAHANQDLEVLDRLLEAHHAALEAMGANRLRAETEVGHALNQLVNVAGSMPELTSSKEFPQLKRDLTRIEEKVTAARRFYNLTVEDYEAARGAFLPGLMARFANKPDHARFDLGERREAMAEPQRVSFS